MLAFGYSHFFHERQNSIDSGSPDVHGLESALGPSLPKIDMTQIEQLVRGKYSKFNSISGAVRIITSLEENSDNRSYDWAKTALEARNALYQNADDLTSGIVLLGAVWFAVSIMLAVQGTRRPRSRFLEAAGNA